MIFFELFYTFFLIGLFTFGGGYAMIPMIQEQVVGKGWITEANLTDFIAVSEVTPGPFAFNISTFVGNTVGGVFGLHFVCFFLFFNCFHFLPFLIFFCNNL